MATRKPYPSDVSDEEWAFVAPYLALVREDAPQCNHNLREVFNGLRWIVRTGSAWRYMPHDLPPWEAVYQQTRRWLSADVFEAMVHDLRVLLRLSEGRASDPTAAILDSRTLHSTPESGSRGGYDGAKRKKGSKVHAAVDPLGHLLALFASPANEQERAWVGELAGTVQDATGESVELAYVDEGYTAERPAEEAEAHGTRLEVVKHEEAKRLRTLATPLGRGAQFRMGIAIQAVGEGLREVTHRFGGVALCRLRLPLPPSGNRYSRRGSMTRSRRKLFSGVLPKLRATSVYAYNASNSICTEERSFEMTTATERPDAAREGLIARHPLVFFFLLSFVFTWGYFWLIWAPLSLPDSLRALGGFGPTVSAFLVLAITSGKPGVLRLLRSIVHWRVGVQWYLVALLGVPVLNLLAFLVVPGALADLVAPDWSLPLIYLSEMAISLTIGVAPLWEEIGWRGFAQSRMQRRHGPVVGTLILGALWGVWHLPFFFGPVSQTGPEATFISASIALVEFSIGLTGLSVVMTWVLNNCGGSVLLAILLHAAFDSSGLALAALFPSTVPYYVPVHYQTLGIAIVYSVAALVLIVATRGQLSYQRYLQEAEEEPDVATAQA